MDGGGSKSTHAQIPIESKETFSPATSGLAHFGSGSTVNDVQLSTPSQAPTMLADTSEVVHLDESLAKRENSFHDHVPSADFDVFITETNRDKNSTWKANECMLTETHPSYDRVKCQGETGYSLAQTKAPGDFEAPQKGTIKFGEGPDF